MPHRLLFAAALFIVISFPAFPAGSAETAAPAAPAPGAKAGLDVDAMASRMKQDQNLYQRLRDESLKAYAKRNPQPAPYDEPCKTLIRLSAYLLVWGDFYFEDLTAEFMRLAKVDSIRDRDPLIYAVYYNFWFSDGHSNDEESAKNTLDQAAALNASEYPKEFALWSYICVLRNYEQAKGDGNARPAMPKAMAEIPGLAAKVVSLYRPLIKQGLPNHFLFRMATFAQDTADEDGETLKFLGEEFDKAFAAEAPDSPLRPAVQGDFYVSYAWNARGTGYANTVTPEGSRLMQERLKKAEEILEAAYVKFPKEGMISRVMMTVELGQGRGRERMELWFRRAMEANPDDLLAYSAKIKYLLPRWYGTDQDLLNVGVDAVKTENWQGRIPMVLFEALSDTGKRQPQIYANPKLWELVEQVYRKYLSLYPGATIYRSGFAKKAALGGHWKVAKEQFDILGNKWSRAIFTDQEYAAMSAEAERKAAE